MKVKAEDRFKLRQKIDEILGRKQIKVKAEDRWKLRQKIDES